MLVCALRAGGSLRLMFRDEICSCAVQTFLQYCQILCCSLGSTQVG